MSVEPLGMLFLTAMLWFSARHAEATNQKQAIAAVEALGGSVRFDYQKARPSLPNVFSIDEEPIAPAALREVFGEDLFRRVVMVSLRATEVADRDLAILRWFPYLENLNLCHTGITGEGLKHLRGMTNLRMLALWRTPVDDDGLKHLAGLRRLWSLSLDETLVTDDGLVHLSGLIELEDWLGLSHTLVSDEGLRHLRGLKSLRHLNLRNTFVTQAEIVKLRQALPKADISFDTFADPTFEFLLPDPRQEDETARSSLKFALRQQLQLVDRICDLSDEQQLRARLLGRSDVERLMNTGDQPLRVPPNGPFGKGSKLHSFLKQGLTPAQADRLAPFQVPLERGAHVQVWTTEGSQGDDATIRAVRLIGAACTDVSLPPLRDLPELRLLALHRTAITDAGLLRLREFRGLEELWIADMKVSPDSVAALQEAKPTLKILRK